MAELACGCVPGTQTRCEESQRLLEAARAAYRAARRTGDHEAWLEAVRAFYDHQERQGGQGGVTEERDG